MLYDDVPRVSGTRVRQHTHTHVIWKVKRISNSLLDWSSSPLLSRARVYVSIQSIAYAEYVVVVFLWRFGHGKLLRCQATSEMYRSQALKFNRVWAWQIEWHGRVEFSHSKCENEKQRPEKKEEKNARNNKKFLTRQNVGPPSNLHSRAREHNNQLIFGYFPRRIANWHRMAFDYKVISGRRSTRMGDTQIKLN